MIENLVKQKICKTIAITVYFFRLDVIEFSALSKNNEVSLAALKSFQELLYNNAVEDQGSCNTVNTDSIETWTVCITVKLL